MRAMVVAAIVGVVTFMTVTPVLHSMSMRSHPPKRVAVASTKIQDRWQPTPAVVIAQAFEDAGFKWN